MLFDFVKIGLITWDFDWAPLGKMNNIKTEMKKKKIYHALKCKQLSPANRRGIGQQQQKRTEIDMVI